LASGFRLLERVVHVAPLGVRFRDAVTGAQVRDGLSVEAYPKAEALRRRRPEDEVFGRRRAFANRSGVQVLTGVPGLSRFETGAVGEDSWGEESPPGARRYVIEVTDTRGRYLPFSFEARLPFKGLFVWEANPLAPESPPAPQLPDGLPLFSAPARVPPAGMAALRAELWDAEAEAPASYALLEARYKGGLLGRGVADALGRVALFVAYPPPARTPRTSPPDSPPSGAGAIPPLTKQKWTIELAARYAPAGSPPVAAQRFPDLYTVLNQKTATLWEDAARTQQLTAATLEFGRECFVRTEAASPPTSPVERAPRAALFITTAA
jgi:hypothetical protein